MPTRLPRSLLRIRYEKAAEAYLRSLPPEHFMEATPQATQRKITLESMDLVNAHRPDVQCFNELLVQYPFGPEEEIRQVVPDNMLILHEEPIRAVGSYDVLFQPARPFLMMEYVSKHSERKDYEDSFTKYEQELKVPYYLTFFPDGPELTLYRLKRRKYVAVVPNAAGRYEIPELELELGIVEGWIRFWFRGELLPLPAELMRELVEVRQRLQQTEGRLQQTEDQLQQSEGRLRQTEGRLQQTEGRLQQTEDRLRQAEEQLERERTEKEQLLARLRQLGDAGE